MHDARMAATARDRILALELRQLLKGRELLIGLLDDQRGAISGPGAIHPRAATAVQLFDDLVVEKGAHGLG